MLTGTLHERFPESAAPRLTHGEDSWGAGENATSNYMNKCKGPPVMAGAI